MLVDSYPSCVGNVLLSWWIKGVTGLKITVKLDLPYLPKAQTIAQQLIFVGKVSAYKKLRIMPKPLSTTRLQFSIIVVVLENWNNSVQFIGFVVSVQHACSVHLACLYGPRENCSNQGLLIFISKFY